MAQTLEEYAVWLDERRLQWPSAPEPVAAKATPALKPMEEVRAVAWSLYGVLLTTGEGTLIAQHEQQVRMQIAFDKTVEEFKMWNHMYRTPAAPWEYMNQQYTKILDGQMMSGTGSDERPELNIVDAWRSMVQKLQQKEYVWDDGQYGDLDDFALKVAYFFHRSLQGVGAMPGALPILASIAGASFFQGLVGDGQPFSLLHLLRALQGQGTLFTLSDLFTAGTVALSYRFGFRQPSETLFKESLEGFKRQGIKPQEILYISPRVHDELALAKKLGFRTALFAGDRSSLKAAAADMKDPAVRPDRILTELVQLRQILGL